MSVTKVNLLGVSELDFPSTITASILNGIVTLANFGGNSVILNIHQVAHGLSTGQAVYFNGSAWVLAKANVASTLGLGIAEFVDVDNFKLYMIGLIDVLSGLTPGEYYFVSDATPGALTATEPTTVGSFSNPILLAISATAGVVLNFRPSEIEPPERQIVNQNSNYTANPGDVVLCDTSAGGFTVTLPSASNTAVEIWIKKVSADSNTLVVSAAGGETIDLAATQSIVTPQASMDVIADGATNWDII